MGGGLSLKHRRKSQPYPPHNCVFHVFKYVYFKRFGRGRGVDVVDWGAYKLPRLRNHVLHIRNLCNSVLPHTT